MNSGVGGGEGETLLEVSNALFHFLFVVLLSMHIKSHTGIGDIAQN